MSTQNGYKSPLLNSRKTVTVNKSIVRSARGVYVNLDLLQMNQPKALSESINFHYIDDAAKPGTLEVGAIDDINFLDL